MVSVECVSSNQIKKEILIIGSKFLGLINVITSRGNVQKHNAVVKNNELMHCVDH